MTGIHGVHVADERDPWLLFGLGLRATLAKLDVLLARYAPDGASTDAGELDDATAFVLGVIALADRIGARLDATPLVIARPEPASERAEWFR